MTPPEAKRAARALFEVCQLGRNARPVLDGLLAFVAVYEEHDELQQALTSPFVPSDGRHAIIDRIATAMELPQVVRKMLQVLGEQHQFVGLPVMVTAFKALVHRHERRVDAEVTTAIPLGDAQVTQLRDTLSRVTGQQVTMAARVDPSIIGGAVARVGTIVYDGSLARQLARIREQLVHEE